MLIYADTQVHVRHVADMHFKGVRGEQTVMDISTWAMHSRSFPQHQPSPKGKIFRAGTGLRYILRPHPQASEPTIEAAYRRSFHTSPAIDSALPEKSHPGQNPPDEF